MSETQTGWRSWDSLAADLERLEQDGLLRELREIDERSGVLMRRGQQWVVSFSSNDYLGLAASTELIGAIHEGLTSWRAGAGSARLVCGHFPPHRELEMALAEMKGTESALCFASGFAVPLGVIPALLGPGDTVVLDKLSHACLVDAARLSGATLRVYPHNHLEKLERLLKTAKGRVLVITESVFSMDGDRAALSEIVELKDHYGAWLLLDEAHAFGVLGPQGRGLAAELGLAGRIELQMGTLSKAVGLAGGFIAGSKQVIDLLLNRARSFIYSTAPPAFLAHAVRVAVETIAGSEGDIRRARLQKNVARFRAGMGLDEADFLSPIIPIIVGDESRAMALSERLREEGFWIPAIRYPTVARGSARLRVTLSAAHESEQIDRLTERLCALCKI